MVYLLHELYWYGFRTGIALDYSWGICLFFAKRNDTPAPKAKPVWSTVVILAALLHCARMKPAWLSSHDKVLSMVRVIHTFLPFDILLVLKPWDSSVWGRSSWSGEKPLHVFREDPAVIGSVSTNFLAADQTSTLTFDFLVAFPPFKCTIFKLFFCDVKSCLGGILASKPF